ncbi:hypothetical protein UPYG_G00016200 [Umbra pygmaea]|uniref:C2H2-type domain-containing protein n=1 Tax=Umbra pygmaea TaxID=75934 RepID=A0ABD0XJV7_UMBPY
MSTKSLLYKTVAYLLPNDLEICRACALLVFFLERTVEAYKTVFLLYTHPDQEYYAEAGPIGNHVRFEILQTLKRGLYFDPEFWNLLNLRTNCLKLMSDKKAAQAKIMEEDKWVSNYCNTIPKEPCRGWGADPSEHFQNTRVGETKQAQAKQAAAKHVQIKPFHQVTEPKKRFHREQKNDTSTAQVEAKRVKPQRSDGSEEKTSVEPQQPVNNVKPVVASQSRIKVAGHTVDVEEQPVVKRRGRKPGPKPRMRSPVKAAEPLAESSIRRSFRQLDTAHENLDRQSNHIQHRHMTRLSEKKPPKRMGRKPQWLLEGTFQAETHAPRRGRKPGRKPQPQKTQQIVEKTNKSHSPSDLVKESKGKQKNDGTTQGKSLDSCLAAREPECKMEISAANHLPPVALAPESQLEVSLPDNELLLVLPEDHLSKQRLVLLNCDRSKPSVHPNCQVKDRHKGELILPIQNPSVFIKELHSYAQMPEMESVNLNAKDVRPYLNQSCLPVLDSTSAVFYQMSAVGVKGEFSSQTAIPTATNMTISSQRVFTGKDVQDKYTPLFPSTNVIVSNIASKRRTPESDWEVANGLKVLTATEVSNPESMSRDAEVTDILKEAMNIANIGLEEEMMDDTDTGSISEKKLPVIVDHRPTSFCWLSNTSMDAFAKEFEKFAKGTDNEIGENHGVVTAQDTDVTLKTLQTSSTSFTQNLKNSISENNPQESTEPPVFPEDCKNTSQHTQTQKDTKPTQQDKSQHREKNNHDSPRDSDNMSVQAEQDNEFEGTLIKPKDIQTPTENILPTTDQTLQLQGPLKGDVLQRSLLSTRHTPEVPAEQDPLNVIKGPSENALNVPKQTDDPLKATMITEDTLNVTISEVTADMLQVSGKSTKDTMGTPNVSVDKLAQTSCDSLQLAKDLPKNRDDISQKIKECPMKALTQDSSDTTRQMVIVDTVDVPIVTVVSRFCSVITEDVLKITDNILNDSKGSLKESQDSQNTGSTQKVPEETHQLTESTPQVSDPQQDNITNQALQHPNDPTKKSSIYTPEVNVKMSDFNDGTKQNTYDLSVIVEDTPKVTKGLPHNINDNSLVVSKSSKFSESPKGSVKKTKGPNYAHTVTKNTTKVPKDSPQKANYTSNVIKDTPMVSGGSVQNPEEATPHETVDCQLAYCCSLCNKVFNGEHVIGHAMYHFRKDQCMFCTMLFTDDLVAMMHLSEHIDQLKKGNINADIQEVRDNTSSGTAEKSERSAWRGKRGRKRASLNSTGTMESSPPDRRELRSTNRLSTDCHLLAETSKKTEQCDVKQSIQKVNGHIGREHVEGMQRDGHTKAVGTEHSSTRHGKELSSLKTEEVPVELSTSLVKIDIGVGSSKSLKKVKTCSSVLTTKVEMGCASIATERQTRHRVSPPEKLVQWKEPGGSCPIEGCSEILTVKSRAGLAHILDCHRGEAKSIEIAFCHCNGKCSICQKQGLTLLHYQHHVERHREIPRHPCLHNGCKARFGSVAEMKNHAKTHRPLQVVCCFPGCKKRLSCFLDLNRHELEHYPPPMEQRAKRQKTQHENGRSVCRENKTSATDSASNIKVTRNCDLTKKPWKTQVLEKRQVHKGQDSSTAITLKMTDKLRVNRKMCVGNNMDNSTAPNTMTTPKQAEKVTRQFKVMNKLKKAKAAKSLHVSKEKDNSTPTPNITSTAQKVKKKSKVIDKLMKMQVIQKQDMDTPTGPATNEKVTEKVKLTDELKKTKQPVQKRSATKKQEDLRC